MPNTEDPYEAVYNSPMKKLIALAAVTFASQAVVAFAGEPVEWDVLNEPYSNHDVMDVLGKSAVVGWYKGHKMKVHNVDAAGSVDEVTKRALKALGK